MIRPLNEIILKIWFTDQGRLLTRQIEREKFCPEPGLEPGPLASRANALRLSLPGQVQVNIISFSCITKYPLICHSTVNACLHGT